MVYERYNGSRERLRRRRRREKEEEEEGEEEEEEEERHEEEHRLVVPRRKDSLALLVRGARKRRVLSLYKPWNRAHVSSTGLGHSRPCVPGGTSAVILGPTYTTIYE